MRNNFEKSTFGLNTTNIIHNLNIFILSFSVTFYIHIYIFIYCDLLYKCIFITFNSLKRTVPKKKFIKYFPETINIIIKQFNAKQK